ncbi:MAG: hypothetical protein NT062_03855 [Proteobacteria bacterium]|nr:hypothetical protein [Pseudomonadota bacterium]
MTTADLEQAHLRTYRLDGVTLPTDGPSARALGLDLSGDGTVDNQLGLAHGFLAQQSPDFAIEPVLVPRLQTAIQWTLQVYDDDGTIIGARLSHDDGLAPAALLDRADPTGVLVGDGGLVPLGALTDRFGDDALGWIDARHLRIAIDHVSDTSLDARLAISIGEADVLDVALPNLARYFTWELGLGTSVFAAELDTDHDGAVSVAELHVNPIVRSLLDADLHDGGSPALSLGLRVAGTR